MRADQILPDYMNEADIAGFAVRRGTVAAFLYNARTWADPHTSSSQRQEAECDIRNAVPALRALGIFDILAVRDDRLRLFIEAVLEAPV